MPSEARLSLTGTFRGASISRACRSDPLLSRALDRPARTRVECDGVARPARRNCRPKLAPEPQFTISGRRPEVSSNASVEAWALPEALPEGGGAASTMIEVRPALRRA